MTLSRSLTGMNRCADNKVAGLLCSARKISGSERSKFPSANRWPHRGQCHGVLLSLSHCRSLIMVVSDIPKDNGTYEDHLTSGGLRSPKHTVTPDHARHPPAHRSSSPALQTSNHIPSYEVKVRAAVLSCEFAAASLHVPSRGPHRP